jgi:hypothetical protein
VKGETFRYELGNSKYEYLVDDAELKVMSSENTLEQSDALLTHLHICIHCGHSRRREEVGDREISSGIFHCPKCGIDGPLNVEVQDLPV